MKEQKTFTTTISHSSFVMCWENTTQAKQTHQVIVLDSITSSAKSFVFRKQSFSRSQFIMSETIQQHSNIQNLTTYLYSTNTIHANSNKPPTVWFQMSKASKRSPIKYLEALAWTRITKNVWRGMYLKTILLCKKTDGFWTPCFLRFLRAIVYICIN